VHRRVAKAVKAGKWLAREVRRILMPDSPTVKPPGRAGRQRQQKQQKEQKEPEEPRAEEEEEEDVDEPQEEKSGGGGSEAEFEIQVKRDSVQVKVERDGNEADTFRRVADLVDGL
jgi:hypothetical protein